METLMRYADRLNGVAPQPADSSKLKIIFKLFHPSHVMNYKLTGNKFTAATKLEDIIDFMKLQKHNQEMKASQFKKEKGRERQKSQQFQQEIKTRWPQLFREEQGRLRWQSIPWKWPSKKVYN